MTSFTTPAAREPTLTTYTDFARRYRVLFAAAAVVALCVGALLHLSKPQKYTSSADMVIVAATAVGTDSAERDVSIDSALQLLRSDRVIGYVAREIDYPGGAEGLDADVITRPVINSRIVRLSVPALDPRTAEQAVSAIVERFYDVRRWGLENAARNRAEAVAAELEAVETELAQRYGLATDESPLAEEPGDTVQRPLIDIGELVERRAQLYGEEASIAIAQPSPGYVSRPATTPSTGTRSGLSVTMSSTLILSLLAATGAGALVELSRGRREPGRPPTTNPHVTQGVLHGTA